MAAKLQLTSTQESYLETIHRLEGEHRVARVKEIARLMAVSSPSVTRVLHELSARGVVSYEPYGTVGLTDSGREVAEQLALQRRAAQDFLENVLGVTGSEADEVARKMEHVMTPPVLCRLVQFVDFYRESSAGGGAPGRFQWTQHCNDLCERRYGSGCINEPAPPLVE